MEQQQTSIRAKRQKRDRSGRFAPEGKPATTANIDRGHSAAAERKTSPLTRPEGMSDKLWDELTTVYNDWKAEMDAWDPFKEYTKRYPFGYEDFDDSPRAMDTLRNLAGEWCDVHGMRDAKNALQELDQTIETAFCGTNEEKDEACDELARRLEWLDGDWADNTSFGAGWWCKDSRLKDTSSREEVVEFCVDQELNHWIGEKRVEALKHLLGPERFWFEETSHALAAVRDELLWERANS